MKTNPQTVKRILLGLGLLALLVFPFVAASRYQVHIVNMLGLYILMSLGLNLTRDTAGRSTWRWALLWRWGRTPPHC